MKLDAAQVAKVGDWLARREVMNCTPCKRDELLVVGTTELDVEPAATTSEGLETGAMPTKITLILLRCHRCGSVTAFDAAHIDLETA